MRKRSKALGILLGYLTAGYVIACVGGSTGQGGGDDGSAPPPPPDGSRNDVPGTRDAAPGVPPADGASDSAADAPGDAASDAPGDAASDAPFDAPFDAPADAPADAPFDAPGDAPADAPLDGAEAGITPGLVVPAPATSWPVGVTAVGTDLYVLTTNTPAANTGVLSKCTPSTGNCGSPTVLLNNLANGTSLTNNGTTLYFASRGASGLAIVGCPIANCSSSTWFFGGDGWTNMSGVAADSNAAYYAAGVTDGQYHVYALDKALASESSIAQSLPQTAMMASDGTNLYIGYSGGGIYTCTPPSGCATPTLVQATASTSGIAIDSTYLYWADPANATINRCPIAGCGDASSPTVIAQSVPGQINGIAILGSFIFYAVGSSLDAGATNGVYAATR
jgi:hypothetical protein